MDSKSRVLLRMNGRSSKYPLSAQTVPLEVANRNKIDPAQAWPGAPPNFGLEDMPHIFSFVGRYGMVANAYMHADEALLHSSQNAEIMRNEPMIMECIEARMRCVALLNWHIQPVDNDYLRDALDRADSQETAQSIRRALQKPKSDAEFIADKLTSILKHTPNFMKFRYALMDAIWYGKYATVQTMGTRVIGGKRRVFVRKWEPRHGDKLIFRYSDGDFEHDPDQVGIRIGPATSQYEDTWVDYAGFERKRVDPTQHGLVYWFDGQQRRRMCVHKHIIEDADFMRPEKAGSINGVGIRSRIYWTWWAYQESLKLLMEYIERSALGIEIWKYPAHDPQAKARTEQAAKERGSPGRSCVLVPVPTGEYGDMYGVEIVEPGLGGIGELQNVLQTFFGHKIKRYILGQTLTSEAEATGLGSGVADAHLATFHDIVRFDGLNLEETLTTDLIRPLQLWNFPGSDDLYLRFVIDTESPDAQERIAGYQAAWAMGLKIRTEDMYDALGAAPPSEGEDFLDNPGLDSARIGNKAQQLQMEQMQMQMEMQMQQPQQVAMAPFPTGGGVPGDGDNDGLATDDDSQLFDDNRGSPSIPFQTEGNPERYAIKANQVVGAKPSMHSGTESFKRWFGASKAVDESGTPKVLYHGTSKSFDKFGDHDWHYLSESPEFANKFAVSDKPLPSTESMKPAKFKIKRGTADKNWFEEVSGYQTHVPGLYAHSSPDGEQHWVTHGQSGYAIGKTADWRNIQEMLKIAKDSKFDWTQPYEHFEGLSRQTKRSIGKALWEAQSRDPEIDNIFGYKPGSDIGVGSQMKAVHASIQNPVDLRAIPGHVRINPPRLLAELEKHGIRLDPKDLPFAGRQVYQMLNDWTVQAKLRDAAVNAGYDGLVFNDWYDGKTKSPSWVAFHPEQIKSATGNRGTFDPKDGRVQYQANSNLERYAADDFTDVPMTSGIVPSGQVPQPEPMPPLPKAIRKSALVKNVAPEPVAQQPAKEKRKAKKLPALPYHPDQLEESHWKLEPIRQEVSQEPVYPEHSRSSVKYFDGSHDWNPPGRKPSGQVPAINLAQELDRHVANNGGRLDLNNEQHMQVAADAMHEDVMYALKARKGKITGWYDRSMKRAMKYARKMFPEIKENKDLETVMKLALAISSGGTDVLVNFRQACKQMHHYLMTGQFNEKLAGGGSQQQAIQESFGRANELLRNQSLRSLKKWLLTKKKVGEWRSVGVHMKDELVDHEVYGSNIFGAKIGAFFANLHGKYEPVTMDRWFMRTVNRIRGGLSSGSEMPLRTNAAKIYNYFLHDKNPDPQYLHGYSRKQLMEEALKLHHTADTNQAPRLVDWIEKRFDAFTKGKFEERNYLNNAARNLNSALNIEQIVPASGSDRYHMRKLVEKVQAKLADQGISISNAELQALLWYHEKQLFYHLGYRSSRGESKIAFDEAAKMHHDLTHITGPTKPKEVEPFHWQKALQERQNRRFGNV